MNLTKLFNGKYLKQNLKKSKGLLTLLVLIVPVLTTLVIITQNSSKYECVMEEGVLASVNIIGMYILPIIISVILSGYIYKRNSVDFINSMPMNRKTIYFTNFVGGIIIILFIQVLTTITSLVCANICTGLFLPTAMIMDCFVMMIFSYIFVYSATMLAQTVSGNVLTQIVVTALILFLVPFTSMIFSANALYNGKTIEISSAGNSIELKVDVEPEYTMPFRIVSAFYFDNGSLYNTMCMYRMVILSVVYLIIGMILFERRKMENVGTSFISLKSHYIVKGLTLVPMVFLSAVLGAKGVYLGIVLTLMFVYYVLYDFIVSKKVKLKYTIIGYIATVAILSGVYHGVNSITNREYIETISTNDIEAISVGNTRSLNGSKQLDVLISDAEFIKKVFNNIYDRDYFYSNQSKLESESKFTYVALKLKLKNGEEAISWIYMDYDLFEEIVEKIKANSDYKESLDFKDVAVAAKYNLLSEEDTNRIKEILKENYYELRSNIDGYSNPVNVTVYVYDNHELREDTLDIVAYKEIFDIIIRKVNTDCYNSFKENTEKEYNYANVVLVKTQNNLDTSSYNTIEIKDELVNYIKNHYQDKCDDTKEYIIFNFYGTREEIFVTNYTDELKSIVEKEIRSWDAPDYEDVLEY